MLNEFKEKYKIEINTKDKLKNIDIKDVGTYEKFDEHIQSGKKVEEETTIKNGQKRIFSAYEEDEIEK